MQWSSAANAGFSDAKPWLPVPPSYKTHNVEHETKDPNSVLNLYKKVLALRHTNPALLEGDYIALNEDDPNVMSYARSYKNETVIVALNMSAAPQKATFDLSDKRLSSGSSAIDPTLKILVSSKGASAQGGAVTLEPYGLFIAEVSRPESRQ